MALLLIGTDHVGQTRAAIPVARKLVKRGHAVRFIVDGQGPAAASLQQENSALGQAFAEVGIVPTIDHSQTLVGLRSLVKEADAVLVTMSPGEKGNVEMALVQKAKEYETKVYGYAEVPCGHHAPLWISGELSYLNRLDGIFAAKVTIDLRQRFGERAWEVGPRLDHLTSINVAEVGLKTKSDLVSDPSIPWVWYCGAPYVETIRVLADLIGTLVRFNDQRPSNTVPFRLVVSRHARDKAVPDLTEAYWHLMGYAVTSGLVVYENSADHTEGQYTSPFSAHPPACYRDLLCACRYNGVVVTLHGTDGFYAPYIGVPSILCCASRFYDPEMMREKGVQEFPLVNGCPPQVGSHIELEDWLGLFLLDPAARERYVKQCAALYPLPERSAAEIIADTLHSLVV